MSNVVDMFGNEVPQAGDQVDSMVKFAEKLLQKAKDGQVHGVCGAMQTATGAEWFVYGTGCGFEMIGGLEMAKARLIKIIGDDD